MTKFTDDYFRDKTAKYFSETTVMNVTSEDFYALYLLLKEVAKDVRHACAEVRVENPEEDEGGKINRVFRDGFSDGQQAHADRCMNI